MWFSDKRTPRASCSNEDLMTKTTTKNVYIKTHCDKNPKKINVFPKPTPIKILGFSGNFGKIRY